MNGVATCMTSRCLINTNLCWLQYLFQWSLWKLYNLGIRVIFKNIFFVLHNKFWIYQSRNLSNPFIYLFFTFSLDNFTTRVPAVVYLKVLSREHLQFGSSINLHFISQYIIWCNHQDLLIADSLASPFKSPPFIIFLWFELYFMIMATVLSLQN